MTFSRFIKYEKKLHVITEIVCARFVHQVDGISVEISHESVIIKTITCFGCVKMKL